MRRLIVLFVAVLAMVATFITPAGARPPARPGDANEKVTICHATRSLQNPYVVITIDEAAWQGTGPRAHGDNHDREKNGIEWTDVLLGDGETVEDCPRPQPPANPTPGTCTEADIIVTFDGTDQLVSNDATNTNLTKSSGVVSIPAGEYLVTLGSSDRHHPQDLNSVPDQEHEQWRADFGPGAVYSGYSRDLPNSLGYQETVLSGTVTLTSGVVEIIAEHWDANLSNTSVGPDSVLPVCVALVRVD